MAANGSGHQPPLVASGWHHFCAGPWTLFFWGQSVTHKLVTILTVVWDCHHSLNGSDREEGRVITRIFASSCLLLFPHSLCWPHMQESVHSGEKGAHLDTTRTVVGSRDIIFTLLFFLLLTISEEFQCRNSKCTVFEEVSTFRWDNGVSFSMATAVDIDKATSSSLKIGYFFCFNLSFLIKLHMIMITYYRNEL